MGGRETNERCKQCRIHFVVLSSSTTELAVTLQFAPCNTQKP